MISHGRPKDGYSDYENLFHILHLELDTAISILKINISNTKAKYEADKTEYNIHETEFETTVKEIIERLRKEGEDPENAISMAESEAQGKLGFDPFYEDIYELEVIQKLSNDGHSKAAFIMMYSSIEYFLIRLCNILKNRLFRKLDIEDLSGKGYINSCFLYFEKVVEIAYDTKEYDMFKRFQLIRNTIIHNNSSTTGKDIETITSIIHTYKSSITIEEDRFQFKDTEIVIAFFENVKRLLASLELNIEKTFNFECLLYKLKHDVGYSKIAAENGKISLLDNKLIYDAEVFDGKKATIHLLKITMEPSGDSVNNLIIVRKPEFVTKMEIEQFYENSKSTVRKYLKEYRKLIDAKNIKYEMTIY